MSPEADRYAIVVALVLTLAAVLLSVRDHYAQTGPALKWLLTTSTAAEAAVIAGAIGAAPASP